MLKVKKGISRIIFVIGSCILIIVNSAGCKSTTSNTDITFSSSDFNGVKDEGIHVKSDIDKLNLDGTIEMKDGTVNVYVKVKDTDEKLYAKEFTANNSGKVSIDIDKLGKNKDLVLELEGKNVKNLTLCLNSKQKLVLDPEVPKKPNKPSA